MSNAAAEMVDSMKVIAHNQVNSRNICAMRYGIYNGEEIVVEDRMSVPVRMIRNGELLTRLVPGSKVKIMRNDGGREYYIMEKRQRNRQLANQEGKSDEQRNKQNI